VRRSTFQVQGSKFRRGVSLIEVLFAILVTTIGLFGALALLPVASAQARKGRINDFVAVAAPNCIHEFDARGMRRGLSTWIAYDPAFAPPQFRLVSAITTMPYGTAYCIDPRFIAAHDSTQVRATAARSFPYDASGTEAKMLRVTLSDGGTALNYMKKLQAESIFSLNDDLAYDRPDDNSLAPTQQFDLLPAVAGVRARRRTEGHMSWMATVVPKVDRYTVTTTDQFVLSIVMFHDRPTSFGYDEGAATFTLPDERTVSVGFPGSGVGGGEVLLAATTEAALKLRPNDWLMLSGTMMHVLGSSVPVFKWYRVSDTEAEVTFNGTNYERYVTLAGPDWDVTTGNPRAVIVEGVVGVYEKTIRLE
jgi:hypothetical protein